MKRYVAGRLLQLVFVFLGVTFIMYAAVWTLPGDPIVALGGGRPLAPSTIRALRLRYHLDDPLLTQYGHYLWALLHGDLGVDFNGRSVSAQLSARWPVTIRLGLTAWMFEIVFGLCLGVYAAIRKGKVGDYVILVASVAVISLPLFVLGYSAQVIFGNRLHWFPVAGITDGWPRSYVLPALLLASLGTASVIRLVRANVVENMRADYTRTAYAKGLTGRRVIVRHVLRTSLGPAVTFLGIELGYLLGGAVVIEAIFNLPGVGQLLLQSVQAHEGTVVVGVGSILVTIFLLANLAVDLLYVLLDPRATHD